MIRDLASLIGPAPLWLADLHVHSRYSRATSGQMEVDAMAYWARRKGLNLVGTGDFTHPEYFRDLRQKLEPHASGFYAPRGGEDGSVLFVPTAEVSNMFKQNGRGRRVHTLLIAPSLDTAQEINRALASRGNVASDGRPIFGFSVRHLAKLVREIDPRTLVIPAHIWTPWFSVLGEQSGFDTLAEAFEEELDFIPAVETGLSSDPEMNWRLSQLDPVALISNSDAHSPSKLGRECNAFAGPLTFDGLAGILRARDTERFRFTIEFFPEEGKYHWPGHRECGPAVAPEEFARRQGICRVCGRKLTPGVASRVEMLADRPAGYVPERAVPSVHLIPLEEVLSEALGCGPASKKVTHAWDRLVEQAGNEFKVLLFMPAEEIAGLAGERVAEAVRRMRAGEIQAQAGYDGVYGRIGLFEPENQPAAPRSKQKQMQLL